MIDFTEDLRQTLVALARENKALSDNLTAVQTRCTELLEDKRLLYKTCETLRHERNLAVTSERELDEAQELLRDCAAVCRGHHVAKDRLEAAKSVLAPLLRERDEARAERDRLLEDERALYALRETIDEHLPHYEPEHENGDYTAVVTVSGAELLKMNARIAKLEAVVEAARTAVCHHSHTAYQYSDALSMIRAGYAIAASRGVGPWAKKALEDSGGSA